MRLIKGDDFFGDDLPGPSLTEGGLSAHGLAGSRWNPDGYVLTRHSLRRNAWGIRL